MKDRVLKQNPDYKHWLAGLKQSFRSVQLKAAVSVNSALLEFYWQLGSEIVERQQASSWGEGFLARLSQDLMAEFPDVKGFSKRNLEQIRKWYRYWSDDPAIAKQAATQIVQIPWWHNVVIVSKCQSCDEALYYVTSTLKHGWSRSVLTHQIESGLWLREGEALNNFTQTLLAPQSDLARQTLKDPYLFDFLSLEKEHTERELE